MADRNRPYSQAGLKSAFYKSFKLLGNSGWNAELSTCALLGLYQRSRLRSSSDWCWSWPARARGLDRRLTLSAGLTSDSPCMTPGRPPARRRTSKRAALLPPYTTGIVRIRSNLDIKLGRPIGGQQWRAADRRCALRCGHSSRGASGLGVVFVGALCRRIGSRDIEPAAH
jgi:hypothetical protein